MRADRWKSLECHPLGISEDRDDKAVKRRVDTLFGETWNFHILAVNLFETETSRVLITQIHSNMGW